MKPEINHIIDAGSPDKNEDYIWIGPKDGIKAVLILDGTSGTADDFGAKNRETGGQRYVRKFGESVKDIMEKKPGKDLEAILKEAINRLWNAFEEQAAEATRSHLDSGEKPYPRADTVPQAVGCLIRWDKNEIKIMHVGDVESYIVRKDNLEFYNNETHEAFDARLNDAIEKEGKDSEKTEELVSKHRSASNLPGTYPQIGFNPLAVEKLGEKETYDREKVERILLSTDGGTTRMKKLFEMDNEEVLEFIDEKGVENALESLRDREEKAKISELKQSDDAAIVDLRFQE